MDLSKLKRIKQELEGRTVHPDKDVLGAYKKHGDKRDVRGTDPNYAGFDKEGLDNLEIKHFEKIREDLNDDAGFKNILEEINVEDIKTNLAEKKHRLDDLRRKEPSYPTRGQARYTRWTGRENSAEIARSNWRKEVKTLDDEIDLMEKILIYIRKLKPIYESETSAGKKRTRRNRKSKKSKKGKSRKNRKKSNRRR
tara:strand:- start:521 stop:1108 length:588 start_codon:yes stop_codon:yes gene_type:complete